MRLRFWNIVVVLLLAVSCTGPRTIPRDTLGDIFGDMFLQDQQIKNDVSRDIQCVKHHFALIALTSYHCFIPLSFKIYMIQVHLSVLPE